MEIEGYPFVVNETPYCIWDVDLRQLDLRYLKSIDPTYFQRVAEVNGKLLAGENPEAKYAATALRAAYSHGMRPCSRSSVQRFRPRNASLGGW